MEPSQIDPTEHLASLPADARSRELWMQHTIGYVLMLHMREYAAATIPDDADPDARRLAMRVLDHALFGLMEICEGYNLPLRNGTHEFEVDVVGRVRRRVDDSVVASQTLGDGDGACMGFHFWVDGEFGDQPPVERVRQFAPQSDWLDH
ncbi:hypothetical protein [Kineosporia sp. A_224]|uniref:hypothetical protein n=1 Tax=Kineosporia sp. A_224 TaxID=1962180 RepID=UPI000B4A7499|nr:hypothetical protein [Kineosporia sp. A_224]